MNGNSSLAGSARGHRQHNTPSMKLYTITALCLCTLIFAASTSLLRINVNLLGDGKRRNPMAVHAAPVGSAASALTMFVISFVLFYSVL